MKLIGLMLVRNEEWILGCSLRAALKWCDSVVVLDHASTDKTPEIVEQVAQEVGQDRIKTSYWHDGTQWSEMEQREFLLFLGREDGGTHFALIDADEILTANHLGAIRGWVETLQPGYILELPMIAVWDGLMHYRDDSSIWSHTRLSVAFADKPGMGWKPRGDEAYQHHNRTPHGMLGCGMPIAAQTYQAGGVMHLQWADWDRVVAKHRRYKLLERVRWPQYSIREIDDRYNMAVYERAVKRSAIPMSWWTDYLWNLISLKGPYWFDDDSARMWDTKGADYFKGLNLFGWRG